MAGVEDTIWYYRALHRHVARSLGENLSGQATPAVLDAGCLLRHLHAAQPAWRLSGLDFAPLVANWRANARDST